MLTAFQQIEEAVYRAKVPGYTTTFAIRNLNAILSDLCQHHDFALARGVYNFNFNPALATMYGSGPYSLPLDYLRTSGSSGATGASRSAWYLYPTPAFPSGQPIYMTPIDLAEFDQFPQFPSQSTPSLWATDMGGPLTQRIILSAVGDITGTDGTVSNIINADGSTVSLAGLTVGLSAAGEGIEPGSTILAIDTTTNQITLSLDTSKSLDGASVFFGIAPVAYVYPPPLGSYPATVRYQRQMPPIVNPQTVPWFPDEGYLITELASRLCEISDDQRALSLHGLADMRIRKYLQKADDKTNRSQQIQLDQRNFGGGTAYDRARNTKHQGWLVLLTMALGGILGLPIC
jgi:hypothetical protein